MNIYDFVYKEIYSRSLKLLVPEHLAEQAAANGVKRHKENRFSGSVIEMIQEEVRNIKRAVGK